MPRAREIRNASPTLRAVLAFLGGGGLLALLTAVAAPGLWTYWLAFLALAALLFGTDRILGPHIGLLHVRLETPDQLYSGAKHKAALLLENPVKRTLSLHLKLDLSSDLDGTLEGKRVAAAAGTTRIPLVLRARRRGRVTVEALWIRARGPLGLIRSQRCVVLDRTLTVIPNLPAISADAIRHFSTRNVLSGVRVERFRGDGSEFDSMREYVPGFDIRSVDWKASARHAKLLCREMRAERNRRIILAVDSGRLMNEPLDGAPRLDHAINAALALASVSLQVGDWVGLLSFDNRLRHYCPPLKGRGSIRELNETASRIDYSTKETNFTLSLTELSQRETRRALVVVLTDFVDSITAELMIENLMRVSRRHKVLFVAMDDPSLLEEAARRPTDTLGLHRAVVAHNLLKEREIVFRRLRRSGVHCVNALPGRVSSRLIDQYLELKRKEAF